MKRCPTCNRTYADDGFTFCLDDGALLSAPYDPNDQKPVSTIQSGGPPPTAVMPGKLPDPPAPTIASPPPAAPVYARQASVAAPAKKRLTAMPITIGIVLVLFLGYLVFQYLYTRSLRGCPRVRIECVQADRSARCYLTESSRTGEARDRPLGPAMASLYPVLALQEAAQFPPGVSNVRWSVSRGTITSSQAAEVFIDTTGYENLIIEVTAKFDRDSMVCPKEAHNLLVVQRQQSKP